MPHGQLSRQGWPRCDPRWDNPVVSETATERPINSYAVAGFVYVLRDGKVLMMKRTSEQGRGMWAPAGGVKEHGEGPEDAARRELFEETGLVPSGSLDLVAVTPLHLAGMDWIHCWYACESVDGEVVIDAEHSDYRWMDPLVYRERSYSDDVIKGLEPRPTDLANALAFRDAYDGFLSWLQRRS